MLDTIGSEGRLASAGRALLAAIDGVPNRPAPFVDAVLGWVAREAAHYGAGARAGAGAAGAAVDLVLLAGAVAPARRCCAPTARRRGARAETSRL